MRDYTATPSHEGACVPCCQVCVFFFTAFLIVAERTARESYLTRARAHTRPADTLKPVLCFGSLICEAV